MKDTYFLVFDKRGITNMLKNAPRQLKAGELAVQMNFEVDDAVFTPFQIPTVNVVVPVEAVSKHIEVSVDGVEEHDA